MVNYFIIKCMKFQIHKIVKIFTFLLKVYTFITLYSFIVSFNSTTIFSSLLDWVVELPNSKEVNKETGE